MDISQAQNAGPVQAALQPYVDSHTLAGAVTCVANKDRVLDLAAVGYADLATRRPMETDSVFWIASMTKPMTATAFMMLVDEGRVSVDDPAEKYIPEFHDLMVAPANGQSAPQKLVHPILIRELLSHNSGLDFAVPEDHPPFDRLSLAERVQFYAKHLLLHQPGTFYRYSNAGTNTVGRMIEILSGMPYERFMDERLFKPLGMTETTFWPNKEQIARLATSYKTDDAKTGLVPVPITQLTEPFDHPGRTPLPAGGLFSTASDVTKFMQLIAANGLHNGKPLVSASAIQQMGRKETSIVTEQEYGFGWGLEGGRIGHGGAYKTSMYLSPKTGMLTVFLVQQAGAWPNEGDTHITQAFDQVAERLYKP